MSTARPVRVGVVGRGIGGRIVAPAFDSTEGCEVIDVVSPRDGTAVTRLCARRDVDLISVHSPPFLHLEHVRCAVENGRAVLCDKPFGLNASEAAEMRDFARRSGVVNLVNFEFRHHPARRRFRELILDGAVGPVEHIQWISFASGWRMPLRPHGWLFESDHGGGWIRAWAPHIVDFLRWTFGDILEAHAVRRTSIPERPDMDGVAAPSTAEDGFAAVLRMDRGTTASIDTTFAAPVGLPPRVIAIGSDGILELVNRNPAALDVTISRIDTRGRTEDTHVEEHGDPHRSPMERWVPHVRDAVRNGASGPETPTLDDGVACAVVLDTLRGASRPADRRLPGHDVGSVIDSEGAHHEDPTKG